MPLKRCGKDGKGWKWGNKGKCYTGKDAKKKAIKQGLAISPEEFRQKAKKLLDFTDKETIIEIAYESGMELAKLREIEGQL